MKLGWCYRANNKFFKREQLKCIFHAEKLSDWEWDDNTLKRHLVTYIYQFRLQGLTSISYRRANWVIISALCQPETNTFHMSFGEMTITLEYVPTLVGISVMDRSVNMPERITDARWMLVSLLSVSPQEADDELGMVWGSSVRLEWLRSKFFNVTDSASDRRIDYAVKAYLLYLVGCTLFSDKSGTRVSIDNLKLSEDLDLVSSYAWGDVALAYLYRQLGNASRDGLSRLLEICRFWRYY